MILSGIRDKTSRILVNLISKSISSNQRRYHDVLFNLMIGFIDEGQSTWRTVVSELWNRSFSLLNSQNTYPWNAVIRSILQQEFDINVKEYREMLLYLLSFIPSIKERNQTLDTLNGLFKEELDLLNSAHLQNLSWSEEVFSKTWDELSQRIGHNLDALLDQVEEHQFEIKQGLLNGLFD